MTDMRGAMRPGALLVLVLCAGCWFDHYDQYYGPTLGGPPPSPAFSFHVPPHSAMERAAITPAIQVWLIDFAGNLIPNAIDSVTVRISNNPGGGTLSGTTTVAAGNGTATLANLSIDARGEAYTLAVAASGYPDVVSGPFNVSCTCWTTKAPLPTSRYDFRIGVVDGVLYAVGGRDPQGRVLSTVEAYDPATNSWATKAPMPTPRSRLGVGVVSGVLYAIGGLNQGGADLATVEAYDPVADRWTAKAPLPTPRSWVGVGVLGGVLYVVGGYQTSIGQWVATLEAYSPVANDWTSRAPMLTPHAELDVGAVSGLLYAVGGYGPGGTTVEAYDPVTNSWTPKAPVATPRSGVGVGVVSGVLYAVGGRNGFVSRATIEAYDPVTNTWTLRGPMPTSRGELGVGVVNGVLYALGGLDFSGGGLLTAVEAYDPAEH